MHLDEEKTSHPPEKVTLIDRKLRKIIDEAKSLKSQPEKDSSRTLPPHLKLIFELLHNVQKCKTNKLNGIENIEDIIANIEDGIDNTYQRIHNLKIISEEEMIKERIIEDGRKTIIEQIHKMIESYFDGNGHIVQAIVFPEEKLRTHEIHERTHQKKYISNVLGREMGIFLKDGNNSYDPYGSKVLPELRESSKQKILDALYEWFTPETVIYHYLSEFDKKRFKMYTSGEHQDFTLISSVILPEELSQKKEKYFDLKAEGNSFPHTPLLVAEVLIRLGILERVDVAKISEKN
jgi:hypothetical protein